MQLRSNKRELRLRNVKIPVNNYQKKRRKAKNHSKICKRIKIKNTTVSKISTKTQFTDEITLFEIPVDDSIKTYIQQPNALLSLPNDSVNQFGPISYDKKSILTECDSSTESDGSSVSSTNNEGASAIKAISFGAESSKKTKMD